jgi:uncharacterized protein YbjT (DUF2867 family)
MSSTRDDQGASAITPVLVTGGTGTLGRLVVARLRASGRGVRVLSRHPARVAEGVDHVTCDLLKDDAIETAIEGAEIILHLAGGPKGDGEATLNLARAAARTGTKRLVFISVIGADRLPLGYFRSKLAAEQAVAASGVPWTTMRAAQFHDFVVTLGQKMAKMPVLPVPSTIRLQPVDADEVVRLPGKAGRAYSEGDNLSLGATTGYRTWEAFLANRFGSHAPPAAQGIS